jgi:lipoprotein-releasing system permease protein
MKKIRHHIIIEIALTHILTRKSQTLIAALGVTFGMGMYIFSSSLMKGFGNYSRKELFKVTPHIKIFKEEEISVPLVQYADANHISIIQNPKITTTNKKIINPFGLINLIKEEKYITSVSPQVNVEAFLNNGKEQIKGNCSGVNIEEADAMFNIQSTIVAGSSMSLKSDLNAILIGSGVANKLNVGLDDNLTISSSKGGSKVMKIVGIFSTGTKSTDDSKCYVHIAAAQQLALEGPTFVSEIYVNVINPDEASVFAADLQSITEYKVEDWKTSNSASLAADSIREVMSTSVAMAIMLIAAFGIYNILNMTISQKMNDIAILKATGFSGKDVISIFVLEAVIMGVIGTLMGLMLGVIAVKILQNVYIGPPVGYFPIDYIPSVFAISSCLGMLVTIGAGYIPALKAAKVDPVSIFRK